MLMQNRVDNCVEALCQKGCRNVWGDIDALESGQKLPEAEGLNDVEIQAVIHELKAVMSVYKGTCSVA
jgi:hypothetical protein